jgi:hypothetical protein
MDIRTGDDGQGAGGPRSFIGIHFKCCGTYCRIYKNRKQDAYEGACPKCRRRVRLPIGEGGTSNRFFEAS